MCECGGVSCGNRPSYYAYKTPIYKLWLMANGTLTEKSMWETERKRDVTGKRITENIYDKNLLRGIFERREISQSRTCLSPSFILSPSPSPILSRSLLSLSHSLSILSFPLPFNLPLPFILPLPFSWWMPLPSPPLSLFFRM